MKYFSYFLLVSELILTICSALMIIGSFIYDDQESMDVRYPVYEKTVHPEYRQADDTTRQISSQGEKVVVYGQSLHVPQGAYAVPEKWKPIQNIASDSLIYSSVYK